jgi:hypothetical protein
VAGGSVIRPYPMLNGALAHDPAHSIATTGILWMRFQARPRQSRFLYERSPLLRYVQPIAKGTTVAGDCELAVRYHSDDHPDKPGQICGYAFNPGGGLGAGARCRIPLIVGAWNDVEIGYHVGELPGSSNGFITLRVNGVLGTAGEREFLVRGTPVVPVAGPAPVVIAHSEIIEIAGLTFDDGELS